MKKLCDTRRFSQSCELVRAPKYFEDKCNYFFPAAFVAVWVFCKYTKKTRKITLECFVKTWIKYDKIMHITSVFPKLYVCARIYVLQLLHKKGKCAHTSFFKNRIFIWRNYSHGCAHIFQWKTNLHSGQNSALLHTRSKRLKVNIISGSTFLIEQIWDTKVECVGQSLNFSQIAIISQWRRMLSVRKPGRWVE